MIQLTNLRVFNEARANVRSIAKLCERTRGFGDLSNQAKRAAVSVVSNIAAPQGYRKGSRQRHQAPNQKIPPHRSRIQS